MDMDSDPPTVEIIQNMDSESLCVFVIITSLSDDVVLDILDTLFCWGNKYREEERCMILDTVFILA